LAHVDVRWRCALTYMHACVFLPFAWPCFDWNGRNAAGNTPEVAGCLGGAGLVIILTLGLTIYGAASFQSEDPDALGVKTLTGRSIPKDPLQSKDGWNSFASGFLIGGLSGVAYAYLCTQLLPYY